MCCIKFLKTRVIVNARYHNFSLVVFLKLVFGSFYVSAQQLIQASLHVNGIERSSFLQEKIFVQTKDIVTFRAHVTTSTHTPVFSFLDIVHETRQRVVVYKNTKTTVYLKSSLEKKNSLSNYLLYLYPELYNVPQCGVLHRLDKSTSGLIVIAKTLFFYYNFLENMRNYVGCKIYNAVLADRLLRGGPIIAPIHSRPGVRSNVSVTNVGKYSATFFSVKRVFLFRTYVSIYLGTGRKHQIRAHFNYVGIPVVGDCVYCKKTQTNVICSNKQNGNTFVDKPALTARQLVIKDCNGRFITFISRVSYFFKFLLR